MPAEQTTKMMDAMLEMIAAETSWEKVKADYVTLYADTFSAAELAELIAFYRSPAGKAFVAKQSELTRKSIAMPQKSTLRLMPKIMAMTAASARKAAPPVRPTELICRRHAALRCRTGHQQGRCLASIRPAHRVHDLLDGNGPVPDVRV
jgi:hypothetical protein